MIAFRAPNRETEEEPMLRAHRRAVVLSVLSAVLLAGAARAQEVHVVNATPGPGVDFTTVQAAVNAASDGDVLLIVGLQTDDLVSIVNKRLVLAGLPDSGNVPAQVGRLDVRDLAADKSVVVRHLTVSVSLAQSSLVVDGCAGPVLFEDCSISAGIEFFTASPTPTVAHSGHVVFTRCALTGSPDGSGSGAGAGPGLLVDDASVSLYECHVNGGHGSNAIFVFDTLPVASTPGGVGVRVLGGTLFAAGSVIAGGAGGNGALQQNGSGCLPPSNGGLGLELSGLLRRLDATISGGAAGNAVACGSASDGPDLDVLGGGSVMEIPEMLRSLEITSPVQGGDMLTISIQGQPGELVLFMQALAPLGNFHVGLKGTLAGSPPYVTFLLGPLGGDGTLTIPVLIPPDILPPGLQAVQVVDQLVVKADGPGGLLSSPSTVLIVDQLP
jgi:hypothetical protein